MENNTVELTALKAAVSQLSQDLANLIYQRNVNAELARQAQAGLAEANTRIDSLLSEVSTLRDDLHDTTDELVKAQQQVEHATRFMSAENALAFVSGGEPVA